MILTSFFSLPLSSSSWQALGENEAAHTAYSASLCMWKQNPDAWHSWGHHCDRSYEQAMHVVAQHNQAVAQHAQQVQHAQQLGLAPPPAPLAPPPPVLHPQQYLEYAVYCYLQGVRLGNAAARAAIPRILYLLSFDNEGNAVGGQVRTRIIVAVKAPLCYTD